MFFAESFFVSVKVSLPAVLFPSAEYFYGAVMLLTLIFYGCFLGRNVYIQTLSAQPGKSLLGYGIRITDSYRVIEAFF